jgi:hypothetical protein
VNPVLRGGVALAARADARGVRHAYGRNARVLPPAELEPAIASSTTFSDFC